MLFVIFLKSQHVSVHQLNSKNIEPVFFYLRLFLGIETVAVDGKDTTTTTTTYLFKETLYFFK